MKPPSDTRLVAFRDVPNGTVVWHEGYWGVVSKIGQDSACRLDRWDAPAIKLEFVESVSVPYPPRGR